MTIKQMVQVAAALLTTPAHIETMEDLKSTGYIKMNPLDFLALTCSSTAELQAIVDEALPLESYNDYSKAGKIRVPPFLKVEVQENPVGKILGHEGRHRAAALVNANIHTMDVFLIAHWNGVAKYRLLRPGPGFSYDPVTSEHYPKTLIAEFRSLTKPINLSTWTKI